MGWNDADLLSRRRQRVPGHDRARRLEEQIAAGELLLAPAREVMMERALSPGKDSVRIEAARFGPEAGLIGAALFAREVAQGRPTGAIEGRPGGAA